MQEKNNSQDKNEQAMNNSENVYRHDIDEIMNDITKYAKITGNHVTSEDIYNSFEKSSIPIPVAGHYLGENEHKIIGDLTNYKNDDFYCSGISNVSEASEEWQCFDTICQNGGNSREFKGKMYIPLKPGQHAAVSADILKFLVDNKIVSNGKVALRYRSDSMIIRLLNANDANRVKDFVQDNYKQSLAKHNPFIPDYDGIGLVIGQEGDSSYSMSVAKYLSQFTENLIKEKHTDLINFDNFLATLESCYDTTIQNLDDIGQVKDSAEAKFVIDNLKRI